MIGTNETCPVQPVSVNLKHIPQDVTPELTPTQHPCTPQHFTRMSLLTTPLHLIAISVLVIKIRAWGAHLGLSQPSKDSAPLHIHTNRSINTRKHPNPTPLGKVYKRALVVPSLTPPQKVFVCW